MTIHDMQRIISKINYKDWKFKLGTKGDVIYLQVRFKAPDHDKPGEWDWHKGRKWMLSKHMTQSELVQTALKAVLTAEEHEVREQFKYCNEAIFGPHFDVDELWRFSASGSFDVRSEQGNGGDFDDLPIQSLSQPWPKEGITKMTNESHNN